MVKMFNQVAEGKRRGIARSNKAMFLWIAGMSAIVGVCLVLSIFLINQLAFHGKVVARQVDTLSTISKNKTTLVDLRNNLRAKDANTRLNALKATSDEKGLQVILDALPSSENSLALGASLQEKNRWSNPRTSCRITHARGRSSDTRRKHGIDRPRRFAGPICYEHRRK